MRPPAPSTPVRINLDTTRRCQLRCWYCHSSSGPDDRGPVIDPAVLPELIDTAELSRVFEITTTGGEPTLWPGLIPLLTESGRLHFTRLLLVTNGLATPQRVLDAIDSGNVSRICVSLDGIADVHDRVRGSGAYERTLRGIRELRRVHDNITVISVLDGGNHARWPELTRVLADLGVTAHHLAPVCTAGHALRNYRGLSAAQFAEVRETVDRIGRQVPHEVLFNDGLVHPPRSRTMGLHQFTEAWKGWHRIVRPDGEVRTQIRAWGRSWRAEERQGSLQRSSLREVLALPVPSVAPFARDEEVARKFRISGDELLLAADRADLARPSGAVPDPADPAAPLPARLGISLDELRGRLRATPERFRLRREASSSSVEVVLLFDSVRHTVHLLSGDEAAALEPELTGATL